MRVGRTSIGSRIVSMLLVACMIFGMVPLSAFAAEDATAANLATIRQYAADMLNANFSKAASEDSGSNSDKFTWDTEGKKTNWRYYNGVMLDALLMLGADSDTDSTSSANSALEFAKDFLDTNTENATKAVTHYIEEELDSAPPALVLFDLLDSAEVTDSDRAIYEKAIHYVYGELSAQTKYDACGGNFLHKMNNDSWSFWNIGLDGIYMAQPFLMEYADALADGRITNSSVKPETIYRAVYERLMWVADNMYDSKTGLYHHGYTVNGGTYTYDEKEYKFAAGSGNGVFWSRGIGWYAAGLTMCIELMPEGSYKTDLIAKAKKLFDGMLPYQDSSTGLWYNIVNTTDEVSSSNSNRLETSGSALMAFAMMKAYNNGWVGSSYANAAEKAFNGIVSNKLKDGKITDTYKSSGVGVVQSYYCTSSYVSDEAKGVGPVIMAASEIAKYLGGNETFTTGVVVAPDITTSVGVAPDYSGVKITVVGSNGTVKNVPYTEVTFAEVAPAAVEDAAGDVTVYAIYDNSVIDTFTVSVVDTESSKSDTGTGSIASDASVPGDGSKDSAEGTVNVTTTGTGETTYVLETTGVTAGKQYVIVYKASADATTGVALKSPGGSSGIVPLTTDVTIAGDKVSFVNSSDISASLWTFATKDSGFEIYNTLDSKSLYFNCQNGTKLLQGGSKSVMLVESMDSQTGACYIKDNSKSKYITYENSTWGRDGKTAFYLYEVTTGTAGTTSTDYTLTLTAGQSGILVGKGDTETATAALAVDPSATISNGTIVWSSSDSDIATVDPSTGVVTGVAAGDATITATVTGATVTGSEDSVNLSVDIPVTVTDTQNYSVTLTVEPENLVIEAGKTGSYTAEATVSGIDGYTANITVSTPDASVATADGNVITGVAGGTTSIEVTVNSITNGTNTYDLSDPASVTLNITVNEKAAEEPHIHDYTAVESPLATCTTAGTRTYTCSCGDSYTETVAALGHNYVDGICTRCGEKESGYVEPTTEATTVATTVATEPPAGGSYIYVLDKDGVDIGSEYVIVGYYNDKAYALGHSGTTEKTYSVTVSGEQVTVSESDLESALWLVGNGGTSGWILFSNGGTYIKDGGNDVLSTSNDDGLPEVILRDEATGGYLLSLDNSKSGRGMYIAAEGDWKRGAEGDYDLVYLYKKTPASGVHTHVWGEGVVTTPATCESTGVMTYTCTEDPTHTKTETIPALGHSWNSGEVTTPATCEGTGVMTYTCSKCGGTKTETIAALGHSWNSGAVTTPATCEGTGVMTYTCSCGETKTEEIAALGHNWDSGAVTTEPSCTATGVMTYTCQNDASHTYTETIPMTDHTYVDGTCSSCGATETVTNSEWIHNFTEDGMNNTFYTYNSVDLQTLGSSVSYDGMTLTSGGYFGSSGDYVEFTAPADGTFTMVTSDASKKFYFYVDGVKGTTISTDSNGVYTMEVEAGKTYRFEKNNQTHAVYLEYAPSGTVTVTPASATVTPGTVNVANSGTIDLTGVTMEVTMSDGSTKTVQNSSLTYDVSGINTAIAGTYTVPVSYTEGGKTVSANVSIVVAEASSGGGTTTSDLWKHNFDEDGLTDEDGFFTISGNVKTGIEGSYGDLTFDKGMKMESSTKISFTAPKDGTLTLVMDTANKDVKVNGTSYTTDSNGVVTVNVSAGTVEISKDDSMNIFYMEYAAAVTDGIQIEAPGTLYIAGNTTNLNPVHELHYSIMHNDATVTEGYTIAWSALDSTVVSVASDGTVTGLKPGTTSVTALVTMEDGTEYTATVPVTVAGPSVNTTEEMALIFGEEGQNAEGISATVLAGGTIVSAGNFTLGYVSSDETVATVHPTSGMVTAVAPGTATIYTYIISVNGHTVYEGDGKNPQPAYFDSTAVTVTKREVSSAYLNTYDFVIQKAATADDAAKLIDALTYVSSITGPNGVTAEEGLVLTVEFNTGDKRVLHYGDDGLTVDYSNIDFSKPGVQTALVKYVDPATGEELFLDTIWVHIESFDPAGYDGVITYEDGIHYVLDTDGVNLNEEYIIVAGNGEVALMNPTPTATGSTGTGSAAVTLANGVLSSKIGSGTLFNGNPVDYLTMAESDAQQAAWLLDTGVQAVVCPDGVTRLQVNASNLNRYLGPGESETQLIHGNAAHIYLETVSEIDGEYRIVLGFANNVPYYLDYVDGVWTATTEPASLYLYNKHVEMTQDYGVKYTVTPNSISIPEGFVSDPVIPSVIYNVDTQVSAEDYTIVWTSSNPSVATVDQNGKITGITPGTAVIEATLYDVYGMAVICTTHNVPYVTKVVQVEVTESDPTPVLTPSTLTIGKGTMPNFSKVAVRMTFPGADDSYNYDVPFDQLNFKLVEATGVATDGTAMDHFDNTKTGTYQVPVEYAGQTFTLTIHVVEDPYAGLDPADSIPGFPDAGSVRMNKTATGVLDFSQTGVTKLELTAAGVSTKNSVDVVLIVDVSNSMGWSMDWFVGKTADQVASADDYDKGPAGGAAGTDKLDLAMATADKFADILLNVEGGDNTLTFVTFAGADRDHGGSSDHVDSVRTPMVGVDQYSIASQVFADTKFTDVRYLDAEGKDAGSYKLTIGGYSDDGYGEASVSGSNRGNTNYDFAFGEAIDAVAQLKAKWEANNEGTYEESGRQIHVVFMTDGAPSHYNSKNANGSSDTLWSGSGKYSKPDGVSESSWLTYIENYNELATSLAGNVDSLYTIGFDMAHGGFSTYSYELGQMERVLEGLVKNTVVPVELAENEEELDSYLTTLARALAYAGTNAQVTDVIGGNFSLFTGTSMYSSDITEGGIMSAETLAQMQAMSFPITINSYTLVTAADIDKTLSVILSDGSKTTVTVGEEHLGLRVNENPEVLEQITFSADGKEAYSNLKSGNIMYIDGEGRRVIDAETFTYTATLDTVVHEDVEISHAKDETIVWKIGTITDKEVAMEYYAYLDGALDNPREAVAGVYPTNEYAYAEYVDVYGKYVKRYYGVPQIAWGAGSITVRFYLVNEQGQFVNRAGVAFTNPANRIFLDGRAQYKVELNNGLRVAALDALAQAGLAGTNILYDISAAATVTNSTTEGQGSIVWEKNSSLNNINNLLISTDSSNGFYTSVVLDIPVVMTDLGESLRPMADTTVVIDYGKPMDINVFSQEEMTYVKGYPDVRPNTEDDTKYWYTMEIVGFATYSAAHDLRDYVPQKNVTTTTLGDETTYFSGTYGKFVVTSANGATQVRYIPTTIVKGVESVFVAVAFQEYHAVSDGNGGYTKGEKIEDGVYYMYKQLNILPATVTYYETDGNVNPAFTLSGSGWTHLSGGNKGGDIQDIYTQGSEIYGYDSSYNGNMTMSNGSAYKALGVAASEDGKFPVNAKFTFTGTGFDIISRTGANEGTIRVTYTNKATGASQSVSVINKGQLELHQIPVVSVEGLTYGTYDVLIEVYNGFSFNGNVVMGNEFIFDAVRIYGTLTGSEKIQTGDVKDGKYTTSTFTTGSVYAADGEQNPYFTEIRDILISAGSFNSTGSEGAMYIDDFSGSVDVSNYNTYGANNEVYLKTGNAVAFTFTLSDAMKSFDLGMKSVDGNDVTATVAILPEGASEFESYVISVSGSSAQFYDLLARTGYDLSSGTKVHVVISNTSGGVLSLTDLKVAGAEAVVTSDAQTLMAARFMLDDGNDIYAVSFAETTVRVATTVTLTVTTSADVDDLVITNCYGEEVWFSAVEISEGVWTVKLRPTLLGEQIFTVTAVSEGVQGSSLDALVTVELY